MSKDTQYFYDVEQVCAENFESASSDQVELFIALLAHLETLIRQLGGKIKDTDYPAYPIELFLAYNLALLSAAYNSLRAGYFGNAFGTLRQITEALALALYFYEFPVDEVKYRKDRKSFYSKLKSLGFENWIQGVIQRIDKDGTRLNDHGIESLLESLIYKGIGEEASDFLHSNLEQIRQLTFAEDLPTHQNYVLGPHFLGEVPAKIIMLKILTATVLNMMAIDKIFSDYITERDVGLIDRATKSINAWNKEIASQIKNSSPDGK